LRDKGQLINSGQYKLALVGIFVAKKKQEFARKTVKYVQNDIKGGCSK